MPASPRRWRLPAPGREPVLLEKECALGGLATLGLIVIYLPLCDGYGHQVIGGIGEELLRESVAAGQYLPVCVGSTHSRLLERAQHRGGTHPEPFPGEF